MGREVVPSLYKVAGRANAVNNKASIKPFGDVTRMQFTRFRARARHELPYSTSITPASSVYVLQSVTFPAPTPPALIQVTSTLTTIPVIRCRPYGIRLATDDVIVRRTGSALFHRLTTCCRFCAGLAGIPIRKESRFTYSSCKLCRTYLCLPIVSSVQSPCFFLAPYCSRCGWCCAGARTATQA
jgi:hypothetical protein